MPKSSVYLNAALNHNVMMSGVQFNGHVSS